MSIDWDTFGLDDRRVLSLAEIDEIAARHRGYSVEPGVLRCTACIAEGDHSPWPCERVRLVATARRLHTELDLAIETLDQIRADDNGLDAIDDNVPCGTMLVEVIVDRCRTLLRGEEWDYARWASGDGGGTAGRGMEGRMGNGELTVREAGMRGGSVMRQRYGREHPIGPRSTRNQAKVKEGESPRPKKRPCNCPCHREGGTT